MTLNYKQLAEPAIKLDLLLPQPSELLNIFMAGNAHWRLSFSSFQHILEWHKLQFSKSFRRAFMSGERFVIKKGDRIDSVGAVISEKSATIPWTSLFRRFRNIAKSDF
jgi:hypothetical protein